MRCVRPTQQPHTVPVHAAREIGHLIGFAERDKHFAALGQPSRLALVGKSNVRLLHAPEIIVDRLVLRREGDRIGRLPKLPPHVGTTVCRRAAQRVDPVLAVEIAEQTHHFIEVCDHPLTGEAYQETGASRIPAGPAAHVWWHDFQLGLPHREIGGDDDNGG